MSLFINDQIERADNVDDLISVVNQWIQTEDLPSIPWQQILATNNGLTSNQKAVLTNAVSRFQALSDLEPNFPW